MQLLLDIFIIHEYHVNLGSVVTFNTQKTMARLSISHILMEYNSHLLHYACSMSQNLRLILKSYILILRLKTGNPIGIPHSIAPGITSDCFRPEELSYIYSIHDHTLHGAALQSD